MTAANTISEAINMMSEQKKHYVITKVSCNNKRVPLKEKLGMNTMTIKEVLVKLEIKVKRK